MPIGCSREEATAVLKSGLADAMMHAAAMYVMPICWIISRGGKPFILDNGSAFVLDCGAGPFLVTAGHVYSGYFAAKQLHGDTVCIVNETRFDLANRLIACDAAYDVATFRIEPDELAAITKGKAILTGSQSTWPPGPPEIERGVFFVGFPGDGRFLRPYRGGGLVEVDWVGYTALAVANGVSDTDVTLVLDAEQNFDVGSREKIPEDWALGGCSGAPLLAVTEHNGLSSWRLAGVVYESSSVIIKASRADCINADGTVNGHPNPMAYVGRQQASCG